MGFSEIFCWSKMSKTKKLKKDFRNEFCRNFGSNLYLNKKPSLVSVFQFAPIVFPLSWCLPYLPMSGCAPLRVAQKRFVENFLNQVALAGIDILEEARNDPDVDELMELLFLMYYEDYGTPIPQSYPEALYWNDFSDEDFCCRTRFTKEQFSFMCEALGFDGVLTTKAHDRLPAPEALFVYICYMTTTSQLSRLRHELHYSPARISRIVNEVEARLDPKAQTLLTFDPQVWTPAKLDHLWSILDSLDDDDEGHPACPAHGCVGFLDGTHVEICKPGFARSGMYYSGHKKKYTCKINVIMMADGLVRLAGDVFPGSVHDSPAFEEVQHFAQFKNFLQQNQKCIYADKAYQLSPSVLTPYRTPEVQPNPEQAKMFNKKMNALRVSVEDGFQDIKRLFPRMNHRDTNKILKLDIDRRIRVTIHLYNCYVCFRGSQVTEQFLYEPDIREYLE
eukprot:m.206321 g.206321  ORF g.206321 m.206321 type:complete len:448 (-) comp26060_c0_seq4:45-1388(-)